MLAIAGFALTACAQAYRPSAAQPAPVAAPPTVRAAPSAPSSGVSTLENSQWGKPGATNAQYRADLESCYNFAQAQIAHDERIESDTGAAFDAFPSGIGVAELKGRMSQFERGNRRASLYGECMRAKGYSQN